MPLRAEEGYWKAAAVIANMVRAGQIGCISVSSPSRKSGTTTMVVQVAHLLATHFDLKPLIVEFDFWKPALVRRLKLDSYRTLADVSSGKLDLPDALQLLDNGVMVLAAASRRSPPQRDLAPLLNEIRHWAVTNGYFAILDMPPPTRHGAVLRLAPLASKLILVLREGREDTRSLARFQQDARLAGFEIAGAILNLRRHFLLRWLERLLPR